MQWIRACYWVLIRFLLRFRYRVRVEGLEKLRDLRGPTLVMPNHPGLIDPPLVLANIRIPGGLRPIVTSSMYRNWLLYPLMRLVDAIEVPEMAEHSRGALEQALTMIDALADGLNRGEKFLIYPAGRVEVRGSEEIGATRAVSDLLHAARRPISCWSALAASGEVFSRWPTRGSMRTWRVASCGPWAG